MIRINLLPQAKAKGRAAAPTTASPVWGFVYVIVLFVWTAGLGGIYFLYQGTLEEQQQANNALRARIEQLKQKSARLDEVRAQLERSRQLEQLVADLNRARIGPTRAVMELSKILSPNGGPTIDPQRLEQLRRDNPLAGYNRSWDPRRLWLTSFTEENRDCRIRGNGKTNEDVAEFLRRLALSDLFEEVTLQKTEAVTDAGTNLPFIGFELTCKVRY